jgi:hypothetical protein
LSLGYTVRLTIGTCSLRLGVMFRLGSLLSVVLLWTATPACSSSGGKKPADAGNQDGFTVDYAFGDLPPGCPPTTGNNKHVGDRCTKGGHECPGSLICACSEYNGVIPPVGTPCFCTIAIIGAVCSDPVAIPPGTCGQGATCCSYLQLGSLCVPDVCLDGAACPVF